MDCPGAGFRSHVTGLTSLREVIIPYCWTPEKETHDSEVGVSIESVDYHTNGGNLSDMDNVKDIRRRDSESASDVPDGPSESGNEHAVCSPRPCAILKAMPSSVSLAFRSCVRSLNLKASTLWNNFLFLVHRRRIVIMLVMS